MEPMGAGLTLTTTSLKVFNIPHLQTSQIKVSTVCITMCIFCPTTCIKPQPTLIVRSLNEGTSPKHPVASAHSGLINNLQKIHIIRRVFLIVEEFR